MLHLFFFISQVQKNFSEPVDNQLIDTKTRQSESGPVGYKTLRDQLVELLQGKVTHNVSKFKSENIAKVIQVSFPRGQQAPSCLAESPADSAPVFLPWMGEKRPATMW